MSTEETLTKIQIDTAVSRQMLEDFITKTFPNHVKQDEETAKIARTAEKKVSRAVWMVMGAVGLITILESAHALGILH